MKASDVYKMGPDVASSDMFDKAQKALGGDFDEEHRALAGAFLEVAKEYYRRGAFNMEHRNGPLCEAEDQGGYPCCSNPAEFYVPAEDTIGEGDEPSHYCNVHRLFNRFYNSSHMFPLYTVEIPSTEVMVASVERK